jgi:murein DD-endopeptidase MepM/ murein hydrolase activator NlpD
VLSVFVPLSANAQTSYRTKISRLDNDVVEDLPIPILFGITLRMITPNFGDPRDGGDRTHEGLDILAPKGAPVVSPTEAVVTRTGTGDSSGKYVRTANPGGESFVYMHLSKVLVHGGDELEEGGIIGYVGDTGNASGGPPHLHFEIRDGRRAEDPYPRITREIPLKDKINYLENALKDVDDEDALVEFVVEKYQSELWQAKNAGIQLPDDVEEKLQDILIITPAGTAEGDLQLGSQGPLVIALQGFLIAKNTGPAARTLASVGATGFFGPLTQSALIEYQLAHGITPAAGYFGPKTRAYILANE